MIKEFKRTAIIAGERHVSYSELLVRIGHFAKVTPSGNNSKTIIFAENSEGWIYGFFSVWANNGIAIPVDASSTIEDVAYIINDCHPDCIWTSHSREEVARAAIAATGLDVKVLLIEDYAQLPIADDDKKAVVAHRKEETAVLIYTSGTTGSPKGVMLSFNNLWANLAGVVDEVPIFDETRRVIILLPLHHILPLMGTLVIPIVMGGGVAICPSMTGPDIMDTLCRGKIAIMVGVPRLWQTLYNGIKKKIDASPITRGLFALCAKIGSKKLSRFVFQSVHKKMGGNLLYCVSGGAALDREIGVGLKTLGLNVLEGYGMTETSPIIAFTRPDDIIPGCVGRPLPSVECKLVNGELCAKGPNIMQGYYNRPEETAAVIDKDGFIHTGDLATIDDKGRITITGRTKEIIVLSNGKNVQPNEIEFKLEKYESLVKEVAVTEKNDMLVAIIVPQPAWATGKTDAEMEQLLKREVVEPYNLTVENYKKIMRIFVYHGELPRTRLEKLQRYKLKALLEAPEATAQKAPAAPEPTFEEYTIIKNYIEQEKKLPVTATSHLETDLAMDSLDKVGLQGFIENTFGVQMEIEQMIAMPDVEALARNISENKTQTKVEELDWNKLLHMSSHHLQLPVCSWTHPVMSSMFNGFFKVYNRLSVKGAENIPAEGPFIIAPNHQSFVDGALVAAGMNANTLKNTYFYATEEHVKGTFARFMANRHNIILMEQRNLKNSIMKLAEVLKQGKNIIIFPEGRRTDDGQIGEFKKMFAILSKELNVPIVPVSLRGAFDALPRTSGFIKPKKITVEYLPAVNPQDYDSYEALSSKIKNDLMRQPHPFG